MALSVGARLGPYEILAPLGAGGMGEVYRARDTRLGRDVAVKVISPRFAADADQLRRFEQEARAASQLDHPNILVVHDVGSHDGSPYIVSELLEGESLRGKLGAPLPTKKAVEYAVQVAHGLAAAHEKGIVHRDLKPENLFVTKDGRIKILDFGLAKLTQPVIPSVPLTEALTAAPPTEPGVVMGTVCYMSPEQVLGKPLDARSDLFSLGVVLYEMLAGKRPFQKDTAPETMAAILKEEPPEMSQTNTAVSPALERIVRHCLEKDPGQRFQSAHDIVFGLRSLVTEAETQRPAGPASVRRPRALVWTGVGLAVALAGGYAFYSSRYSAPPPKAPKLNPRRVLVLPFENRTHDERFDSVGAMAADWIIEGLTSTGVLQPVPLTTVLAYVRDRGRNPASGADPERSRGLARELGAATMVSGSCYLSGGSLQMRAEVFDVSEGKLLGAIAPAEAPVERPLEAVHAIRQRLMAMLAMRVDPRTAAIAPLMSLPPSFEAYQAYIAGHERLLVRDPRGAIPFFEKAAAASPSFFHPLLLAAFCHGNLGEYAESHAIVKRLARVRERLGPLEKAMLDELEASFRGDIAGQLLASRREADLAPLGGASYQHGRNALRANRPREAIEALRQLPPDSPFVRDWVPYWWVLSQSQHILGDYREELESVRKARQLHPSSLPMVFAEGRTLAVLRRIDELERLREESLALQGDADFGADAAILGWASELRWHGNPEQARIFVKHALDWLKTRPANKSDAAAHRSKLGMALFLDEHYDDAEAVFVRLAAEQPEKIDHRVALGILAAKKGDRVRAEEISRWLQNLDRPYLRGAHTRGRAAIAAWLGETDRAVALLREALAQGQAYQEMHADDLLRPLWNEPAFQELLKPKG